MALREALEGVLAQAARIGAQATTRAMTLRQQAEGAHRKAVETVGLRTRQRVTDHTARVQALAELIAPGDASVPWDHVMQCSGATGAKPAAPSVARLGRLTGSASNSALAEVAVPWLVPFLDHGHIVFESDEAPHTDGAVLSLVVRLLAAVPPGQLVITSFDPQLRGVLGPLSALRQASLLGASITDEAGWHAALEALTRTVSEVAELRGGVAGTVGELNRHAGRPTVPYRLVVVHDYPSGMTARSQALLARLLQRGHTAGVHFVVQQVRSVVPEERLEATWPQDRCHSVTVRADGTVAGTGFDVAALTPMLDAPPPANVVADVAKHVADGAAAASAPSLNFADVVTPKEQWWAHSSADRLAVTLGATARDCAAFTLGDRVDQLHNVLIGGAVGTGKSNALLVMLHDLAVKYSPTELRMFLLDFKEGLEFSVLAPSAQVPYGLPHAEVLGLDTDRVFAVQVLRHVHAQFAARANTFKEARVPGLAEYRQAHPEETMPRLLVVIDEFQVLLEGGDSIADEAVELLSTLTRKGRAYGVHVVLSSQTISGISALVAQEGAILAQVPIRVVLRTNAQESQVMLGPGNVAAAEQRYRGQAVLNTNYGAPEDNQQAVVAYAQPDQLDMLRKELWERRPAGLPEPVVFSGQDLASLPAALPPAEMTEHGEYAWLGQPVALAQTPVGVRLAPEPGRHVALLGPGDPDGIEVAGALHGALLSLAYQYQPGARFCVADVLPPAVRARLHLPELVAALRRLGHDVEATDVAGLSAELAIARADAVSGAPGPVRVIAGLGLHNATQLHVGFMGVEAPVDALRELVASGPPARCHLVGWWNSLQTFQRHVDSNFAVAGLWQCFGLLRLPLSDVRTMTSHTSDWAPQAGRLVVLDRQVGGNGELAVPFAPLTVEQLRKVQR